jgi:RND family efflux transporter MFP subunit
VQASAVVVPAREARLSFVLSGLVEEVAVREGDQVQAGQTLISLDTSDLEYELVAAQAALTSVELDAQLQRQRRKRFNFDTFNFVYVSPPREKIVIADAKVEQKQSALEIVKASIAQGTLMAPFEGTVVELNVSSGEYIQPTQVVVVIADLQNVYIETTDLSELNVASVEVGQPATVYVEALDDEFPGEVTAISPISDTIGGDVVYKVTVELDEQPIDLLWGMSADVEIDVD